MLPLFSFLHVVEQLAGYLPLQLCSVVWQPTYSDVIERALSIQQYIW